MLLNKITYHAPKSLREAVELSTQLENPRFLAGGTFLLNSLKAAKSRGNKTPEHIISLKKIELLKGIHLEKESLHINAMTTINDLMASPLLTDNFSILKTVCRNISTNPIRNMATVGGNLTSRYTWTELGAVLIALEATMHFYQPNHQELSLSVEDFFKNAARSPGILRCVSIERDHDAHFSYQRARKMSFVDVPMLAICLRTHFSHNRFQDTRVVVNTGVNFAQRDGILEEFLNTCHSEPALITEALNHLDTKIYDTRSDDYKKEIFRVSIKSALKELIGQPIKKEAT